MAKLGFSADGTRLLSTTQFDATAFDATTGKQVAKVATGSFERRFAAGSLSDDGSRLTLLVAEGGSSWQIEDIDLLGSSDPQRLALSVEGELEGFQVSASRRFLLTWGHGNPPLLIDAQRGTQTPVATDHVAPAAVVASTGETFLTMRDGLAAIGPDGSENWNIADENLAFGVSGMALSPDETSLAVWEILGDEGQDAVRIYDLKERRRLVDLTLPPIGRSYVDAARFDGEALIVARLRYEDKDARRLVVQRLSPGGPSTTLLELELGAESATSAIAPDGRAIAVATTGGKLALHALGEATATADATTPARPRLVAGFGHQATISGAAFSPDGQLIATADDDGRIWIWDVRTGRAIRSAKLDGAAVVRFSADGRSVLAVDSSELIGIDVATGAIRFRSEALGDRPHVLGEDPEAKGLLGCTMRGCGRLGPNLRFPERIELPTSSYAAALFCNGRIALLERDGQKRSLVIGGAAALPTSRIPLEGSAETIACAEGGSLVVGTQDGHVRRISPDGAVLATKRVGSRAISQIARLPDGSLIAIEKGIGYVGRPDLPARLLHLAADLSTLAEAPFPDGEGGTAAYPARLAVTADGKRIFTATATGLDVPGKMALWDADGLKLAGGLRGGALAARQVQFLPDGSGLAVTRKDSTAIWSFRDGKPTSTVAHGFRARPSLRDDAIFYVDDRRGSVSRRLPKRGVETLSLPPQLSSTDLVGSKTIMGVDALAIGYFDGTVIWPSASQAEPQPTVVRTPDVGSDALRSFSPDGSLLLTQSWKEIIVHDLGGFARRGDAERLWSKDVSGTVNAFHGQGAGFTIDGRNVLVGGSAAEDGGVLVLDARDGSQRGRIADSMIVHVPADNGAPDARMILRVNGDDTATLMRSPDDTGSAVVRLGGIVPQFAVADREGGTLIVSGLGGETLLWQATSGLPVRLDTAVTDVSGVSISPDRTLVALAGNDGVVRLLRIATHEEIAAMISLADGNWAVVDASGRYDAGDPGNVPDVSWIVGDAPTTPEPIEIYFLDYFEPRLLARHVAGERFAERVPPSARNRVTPQLRFLSARAEPGLAGEPPRAAVTLQLRSRERAGQQSGIGAVKLFRDGQLIATRRPEASDGGEWISVTFDRVGLPPDRDRTVFTAFAFNDDGIKSETVSRTMEVSSGGAQAGRRAYVIAIGVNDYDNPSWNLRYAAADAEAHARLVSAGLRNSGRFEEIVELPLVSRKARSDETAAPPRLASRAAVVATLEALAGDPVSQSLSEAGRRRIESLRPVRPQDFVYFAFAGHGLATEDGKFHLFTQDFGTGARGRSIDDLSSSLDSEHLAALLSRIDARDMLFVIDACNSAASVDSGGFRPGPMDSRGLGQIAYDKSMRVLAASQVEGVALESDKLLHGALTYALLREGLESGLADQFPRDGETSFGELITFAEERVPSLYAELRDGSFAPLGRSAKSLLEGDAQRGELKVQRPAVFDFRPTGAEPIFMRAATK